MFMNEQIHSTLLLIMYFVKKYIIVIYNQVVEGVTYYFSQLVLVTVERLIAVSSQSLYSLNPMTASNYGPTARINTSLMAEI